MDCPGDARTTGLGLSNAIVEPAQGANPTEN